MILSFTVGGAIEAYTDARLAQILDTLVELMGLPSSANASISAAPASVRIRVVVALGSAADVAPVRAAISTRFATSTAATRALAAVGVNVESAPGIAVLSPEGVALDAEAPIRQSMNRPGAAGGAGSSAAAVVAVVVSLLTVSAGGALILWCRQHRTRASQVPSLRRFKTDPVCRDPTLSLSTTPITLSSLSLASHSSGGVASEATTSSQLDFDRPFDANNYGAGAESAMHGGVHGEYVMKSARTTLPATDAVALHDRI